MMMDENVMNGSLGNGMMVFGWLYAVLMAVVLVMAIIALGKYISR